MKKSVSSRPSCALLIGRFQPFHRGHEKAVDYLLEKYPQVRLGIGSSQYKRTYDNPFSFVERMRMVRMVAAAHPEWRGRVKVCTLPDYPGDDEKWASALARRFDAKKTVVGSANALVRKLSKKAGFEVDPAPLFRRNEWVGTQIRAKMRAGRSWEKLVPAPLVEWMKKNGEKIVRESRRN